MPGTKPVVIHQARSGQAGILTQIAFAAKRHWGYPERWIQIWAPLLTITPEYVGQHEVYVAWIDEQPVGFYAFSQKDEKVNLDHLWVLPEYMGMGIGAALVKHIISRCKELGARTLEIESDPNAQGFYERLGAKKVGEVVGEVDGGPRVLPLLELEI